MLYIPWMVIVGDKCITRLGIKYVEKMTPPFFGTKIKNLFVFFDFEPKKCFWGPDSMGFVWGGVG